MKEDLANLLTRNWVVLAPGHFYGAIIKMDAQTYPFLTVPGVRRIRGEYISGGLLAPVYYSGLLEHADEVKDLPAKGWPGSVKSNRLSIRVRPK